MTLTKVLFLLIAAMLLLQTALAQPKKPIPTSAVIVNVQQMLLDVETLSADDMLGRKVGTDGGKKAREYVLKRFQEVGLKSQGNSYLQPFTFTDSNKETFNGTNVIGYIKGKSKPGKYIVITAHYDHLGIRDGQIHNGADDNASGTAALFALAEYFNKNPPENSIIFAAFDAEERTVDTRGMTDEQKKTVSDGLQGSRHFVASPPVALDSMIININLDMISHNCNELYAAGTFQYPFFNRYLIKIAKIAKNKGIKLLTGHDSSKWNPKGGEDQDWTDESDHYPFHLQNIPFIYFAVEDHRDYHQSTDDFKYIKNEYAEFYVRAVEITLEAVKTFDEKLTQIEKENIELQKTKSKRSPDK